MPLTRNKIILPRRPADLLSRGRLLDLFFDLLDYPLIILAAPAGYGKTSLLIDLAYEIELPVCWFALDRLDQDPHRFISYFIAAIAEQFSSFGERSAAILQSMDPANVDLGPLIATIVNEVYDRIPEYFLLILDDYHLASNSQVVNQFVNRFAQEMDEHCHLVLSSRSLLPLPDLPLLVARSQIAGLGFEELAFRSDEIQALVLQNYHVTMPTSAAEELAQETEGWITGLILSAQTMWQGMVDRVRVARVSGVGLYDYLAQQVLDQQPAQIRDFLLRTSLLEEFDAELCEAVFGPGEDWPKLIETVLRSNLFVVPVDDQGTWLRYHHLFRDFMQAWLERNRPGEKEHILRRLAAVYAERQDWENAYAALQHLGDTEATADLVEQTSAALAQNGRLQTVAQWLDELPVETVMARPGLLSLQGIIAVMLGDLERGLSLLNEAEASFQSVGDLAGVASALVRRATAHRFQGSYQASLEDADEALRLTAAQPDSEAVAAQALRTKGLSLYWIGRLDEAIEWLERALEAYIALGDVQNVSFLHTELGMAYRNAGDYEHALYLYECALDHWRDAHNVVRQATLLNNLAVLYHRRGEYARASSLLEEALDCAQRCGYTRIEALALTSLGDLYADLDARDAATEAYARAWEIAQPMEDCFLLLYLNLAGSSLALAGGDLHSARLHLATAEDLARESGSIKDEGLCHLMAGRIALSVGEAALARSSLETAIARFTEGGQQVEAAQAHLYLAQALHTTQEEQTARAHLRKAFQLVPDLEKNVALVVPGRQSVEMLKEAEREVEIGPQVSLLLEQVWSIESETPTLRRQLRKSASTVPFGPPQLDIRAFGAVQVKMDGKPVMDPEWRSRRRVRELFFLFLAHPGGLTKEEVGVILWPEISAPRLKLRFKNAIYRLRRALGQDVVLFNDNIYRFNQGMDYQYDVESFLGALAKGRAAQDPGERAAALAQAVELYDGPFLSDMEQTWLFAERQRLGQLYLDAVLSLASYHVENDQHEDALEYCRRALIEEPGLERAHRAAMRAYAALGDRAAVAQQFESCCKALMEELDSPPSPQTEALYGILMR